MQFPVFPPLMAFESTKKQLVCVRSDISQTNVGQRWSASFAMAVSDPNAAATQRQGEWEEMDDSGDSKDQKQKRFKREETQRWQK